MTNIAFRVVLLAAIASSLAGMVPVRQGVAAEGTPPSSQAAPSPGAGAPQPAAVVPELPPPTPAEQRCGIQILRIAVTAAGGLIDLRFKVLDAAKAKKRLMDPANPPVLMPAGSEYPLTPPRNALMNVRFVKGLVNYLLYPNVRSTVKPGTKVMVSVGGVRLGPITAQ